MTNEPPTVPPMLPLNVPVLSAGGLRDEQPQPGSLGLAAGSASEGDNVISFNDPNPPPWTAKHNREYCEHWCKRVFVIEKTRMLECQDCKRTIDPFDYLMRRATEADRTLGSLAATKAEIRKCNAELERLKMDVSNAKAQLRRATAPLFQQNAAHEPRPTDRRTDDER